MKIGFWELVVIAVVALIVIGPDKLPAYMKSLGKGLVSLRQATSEMTEDLQKEVVEPLQEVAKPLKEAIEPLQDTVASVNQKVNEVNRTMDDLKHPVAASKKRLTEQNTKWICPKCGHRAEGKFCRECGTPKETEEDTVEQNVQEEETL